MIKEGVGKRGWDNGFINQSEVASLCVLNVNT